MNISQSNKIQIVICGAGFGGLKLARKLARNQNFEITLIDKNNYHQFQPLFYQIATSGLEPSAISFPLRKAFQGVNNIKIRITRILSIQSATKEVVTEMGNFNYDYCVIATGANTNFYGNSKLAETAYPMKSVPEAILIRHRVLQNFEDALDIKDSSRFKEFTNIVLVGGGPTGVELAGAFAEMKRYILPRDYPEIDFSEMDIYLLEASDHILGGMSSVSSQKSLEYLKKLGVMVKTHARVEDYDGEKVTIQGGEVIQTRTLIWAAGIISEKIAGIPESDFIANNRIKVDKFNRLESLENVFVIGDMALIADSEYPSGHPQVAQVAIQHANNLAKNLINLQKGKELIPFKYKDLGVMATVGRNLSVVDLPWLRFSGFFAWFFWMFIHLMAIVGVKNRVLIFINWTWNYFTYDQSLRLIFDTSKLKKVRKN